MQALRGIAAQCAVTNGTKIAQDKKLERSGLDKLLDPIFISEVVGAAFPGIKPEEMLIVGDSLTSDIRGGVNAGIQTCWYNPRGHAAPPELRIDYTVSDIAEVLQIVEKSAR